MATKIVPISKFKATCLSLLDQVKRTGEPILVTRRGEPVAFIAAPPPSEKKESWLGSFADSGKIEGDILSPVSLETEWDVLKNGSSA